MTGRQPLPQRVSIFRDDEPVIQSQPLLDGGQSPLFGNVDCWDCNGVLKRPANQGKANMRVLLHGMSTDWNLMARELAMIWFNPRHPAVLARGIHLPADPRTVGTVRLRVGYLRSLTTFGTTHELPADITEWSDADFKAYIDYRCEVTEVSSADDHVVLIKALHQFRDALACGGLRRDPWPGLAAAHVLERPETDQLKTQAISPEVWFPLLRAAWTYISVFGPDILRARTHWQSVHARARRMSVPEAEQLFARWLSNPDNRVPLHRTGTSQGVINWSLLGHLIGFWPKKQQFFKTSSSTGLARRAKVEQLVAEGRTQPGLGFLTEVDRPDGSRGPWHLALQPRDLWIECVALRNACYIFVAAVSMMRDSEIREVVKGSVVEYFGTQAVKSIKRKGDADLPAKYWWLIEPAALAIDTATQLSFDDELAFAGVRPNCAGELFESKQAITDFIARINRTRHLTGLDEIPVENVTPHMFRRTMAMLTHDFPGSEIAVGMQLKHAAKRALANRSTQGYMEKDPRWAKYFDQALAERRFERLRELFDADSRGETIGFGPGADRMREAFAAVRQKAEQLRETGQARRGDIRVEHGLLRRTRFSIRFGKLNHCTMNDDDPEGAKCLEDAVIPPGHRGPLHDRCRPSRCANSMIGPEHLPIWKAERSSLTVLLDSGTIAPNHRASLVEQLRDTELVIKKAEQ
ncbi:hypothetical protein [Streptomyces lunaelactis]|uniref:hypothetical protein n=1 Tax=Streptomyces lunaelactis TaxID=1535768 RepID=UPI0020C78DDC|nr:hypothetical protein [Streptomyces lunaelactis]